MSWTNSCLCFFILLGKTFAQSSEPKSTMKTIPLSQLAQNTMLINSSQVITSSTVLMVTPTMNIVAVSSSFTASLGSSRLEASKSTQVTAPSSTSLPTNSPTNVRPGFCAEYTGTACREILDKSLTQFNKSDRYFDKKIGMNTTEAFAKILVNSIKKQSSAPRCKWLLQVSFCQYVFTPCLPNGKRASLCREDCESLSDECEAHLNQLIGSAGAIKDFKQINFRHLVLPTNCSIYPSEKALNRSCVHLGLFDHSKVASTSSINLVLWASAGAAAFVVIVSIFGVVCWKCGQRKAKRKAREETIALNKIERESTMKARVRQMSILSSKITEMFDPTSLKQFSLDCIEYVSDLGEGQFGLVFKGLASGIDDSKEPSYKTPVAVKTLKQDSNEDSKDEFNQEAALMAVLNHPNIVKLMAVATEEDPYCMIFEFMEFGDLNKFLRDIKPLDETNESRDIELCFEDFLSICNQVAGGMSYLASLHFVHRDLATRNCLVGQGLIVKIADFGLSRDIYSSDYYKVRGDAMLPVRWMPPESLLHGRFTIESDIFSYGVVMWEVFTYGLQPFYGYSNEEVIEFAKQGVLLGQPDDCPAHIYCIMQDCWSRNPNKRPDFEQIMKRLVKNPPQNIYSTPKDSLSDENKAKTVEIKHPNTLDQQINGTYQSPGTLINSGFILDDESKTVLSSSDGSGKA